MILRSPFPKIHYYQNKRLQVKESQYLIPTCSWTLTPIPNWTCSVVTISHFQCTALSMRLNHQLKKDVGCKVLQFLQTMKIKKLLGHKTLWCINTATSSRKKNELGKILSPVIICMNKTFLHTCATVQPLTTLKIILIYV